MHDASAKIPSGILSGNINQLGDFDECLNVIAPNQEFRGKYCLSYIQMTVPDYLPQLRHIRKLLQSYDAFVNEFDDVSANYVSQKKKKLSISLNRFDFDLKFIIDSLKCSMFIFDFPFYILFVNFTIYLNCFG